MLIGYARISTPEQDMELQKDALLKAGCVQLFTDIGSGTKFDRNGLKSAVSHLREGDTLVVWRLDRLGRSLAHLIQTVKELSDKGIGFKSLQESIDTMTSGGKLIFHIFGALAEFEYHLIRERTNAGLEAARARGKHGGRPFQLDEKQKDKLKYYFHKQELTIPEICRLFDITKQTMYKYLKL